MEHPKYPSRGFQGPSVGRTIQRTPRVCSEAHKGGGVGRRPREGIGWEGEAAQRTLPVHWASHVDYLLQNLHREMQTHGFIEL